MNTNRWLDPSQPPRLQQGTQMLYLTAAFDVFNAIISGWFVFFIVAAVKVAGGYGIANEKKAGYIAGCVGAIASLVIALILLPGSPVLGLIGAFLVRRTLESLLYGVGAMDAMVVTAVAAVLIAVAVVACIIPARRAARTNPTVALSE